MSSLRFTWQSRMALFALAASASISLAAPKIVLTNMSTKSGITFRHTDGSSGKRYIVETVSAGLALFDYDNDGNIDIYFLNGAPLKGTEIKTPPRNALYRNLGGWKFVDVTDKSGLGDTGYGLGVAVGDYDNDGDPDVYLNNYGLNVLYRNNGDGTFTDVTKSARVGHGDQVGAGACFLDMEGDGDLDLYVSNYLEFSYDRTVDALVGGYPTYAAPVHYRSQPDTLYRNNGDGTFTDVSEPAGIAAHAGWGMGITCADYDNDGDTDVFIGNDVAENFLFQNDGQGRFEELGLIAGTAYKGDGNSSASMGVDSGDYDNDGLLDFYVTSYQQELTVLYHNTGDSIFEDVTMQTGAGAGTLPKVTWGNSFVDFDNDGDRDIFVACGHLQDNVDRYDDVSSYHQYNILLANTGEGKFIDVSQEGGSGLRVKRSSRGAGFDDLDNDGDVDAVILNSRAEPTLLRNDSPRKGRWLQIRLRGVKTNRDGVGARVTVRAGDLTLIDEVHSGRGYQSHYGTRLYFGLGQARRVDRLEVRWIGGGTDVFENVPTNEFITLVEDSASPVRPIKAHRIDNLNVGLSNLKGTRMCNSVVSGMSRCVAFCLLILATPVLGASPDPRPLAFPGAEGFGRFTKGGRGGDVYHVTALTDKGLGSLRYGIETAHGPRTIVFDVSGTIQLRSELKIDKSYLTLAGQTAPGDGITLRDHTLSVKDCHDIIIRYLRVRLGDKHKAPGGYDTLATNDIDNVILDHLSLSWAIDGTHDFRAGGNFTIQWCILNEALHDSIHPKGPHAMCASYREPDGPISLHHNLFSTCRDRHPTLGSADPDDPLTIVDFRNNVIYNWNATANFCDHFVNAVNNYWRPGPETDPQRLPIAMKGGLPHAARGFMSGNVFEGRSDWTDDNYASLDFHRWLHPGSGYKYAGTLSDWKAQPPQLGADAPATQSASQAYELVLAHAGASLSRDAVDERAIADVRNRTGRLIDSQDQVGGWPILRTRAVRRDSDRDGMPDGWETAHGLNPDDPTDGPQDRNRDGYTNLEEFLNSLVPTAG